MMSTVKQISRLALTVVLLAATGGCDRFGLDGEAPEVSAPAPVAVAIRVPDEGAPEAAANSLGTNPVRMPEPEVPGPVLLTFRVHPGESVGLYARWTGIPTDELEKKLGLRRARDLRVGAEMQLEVLPEQAGLFERLREEYQERQEAEFYESHEVVEVARYVVKPGDSLRAIRELGGGIPPWLMRKVNPDHDLVHLRPGDELNVPRVRPRQGNKPPQRAPEGVGTAGRATKPTTRPVWRKRPRVTASTTSRKSEPHEAWPDRRRPAATKPTAAQATGGKNWYCEEPIPTAIVRPQAQETGNWYADDDDAASTTPPTAEGGLPPGFELVEIIVQREDRVSRLARWAGVSDSWITEINGLSDPGALRLGSKIQVPVESARVGDFLAARSGFRPGRDDGERPDGGAGGGQDTFPYTVRSGDSAWKIATQRFGIPLSALETCNPGTRLGDLRPGQILRIPRTAVRP